MSWTRRGFLRVAGGAAGAVLAGCGSSTAPRTCATPAAGPGLSYCLVGNVEVRVTGGALLTAGQMILFNVDDSSATILARDERGLYALSAICTHQCCIVTACDATCGTVITNPGDCNATRTGALASTGTAFICACHGSEFAADGSVLTGPAVQPLPAVALRRDGSDVIIDLSRAAAREDRVT